MIGRMQTTCSLSFARICERVQARTHSRTQLDTRVILTYRARTQILEQKRDCLQSRKNVIVYLVSRIV